MLLTRAQLAPATAFLDGANSRAVAQKVKNASVKLYGNAKIGGGVFTGSATILGVGTEVAYDSGQKKWAATATKFTVIMTCKHSLYVQANNLKIPDDGGSPNKPVWKQDFVGDFAAMKIYWNPGGDSDFGTDPGATAAIDHVIPIFEENIGQADKMIKIDAAQSADGKPFYLVNLTGTTTATGGGSVSGPGGISPYDEGKAWQYDVMILLSKDSALHTFASTAGSCDYMAGVTAAQLGSLMATNFDDGYDARFIPALRRGTGPRAIQLIQTGYGNVSERLLPRGAKAGDDKIILPSGSPSDKAGAVTGHLQYKASQATSVLEAGTFYSELPGEHGPLIMTNTHGFITSCADGDNSTNSGDSGGGLFAFQQNPTAPAKGAYLVGVTTGSAVAEAPDKAAGMWDFDNNVATSLGPYFESLFDLRFQNV